MPYRLALVVALALVLAPARMNAGQSEVEKICAQAEERYQKLYGDQPVEDGVVIIKMYKYTFCPIDLEVKPGTKLRWINVDKRTSHSVWFKEQGQEESERLFPDEFVEMVMDETGTFNYICGPHGDQENMRARVTVRP